MKHPTPSTDGRGPGPRSSAEAPAQGRQVARTVGREEVLAVTAWPSEDPVLSKPLLVKGTRILSAKHFCPYQQVQFPLSWGGGRDEGAESLAPSACGESC